MASPQEPRGGLSRVDVHTIALVVNPKAGHGVALDAAREASARFAERGVDVIELQGSSPEDARRLIRRTLDTGGIDALAVAGGDGMINLALQEQAGSGVPLGIIPAGTGNDHARQYGLPRDDAAAAADVIVGGHVVTTDLGRITPKGGPESDARWFGTIMCSGFDSLVSDRVNVMTWPHGRNRYNLAIVVEFLNFHALPFRITLDDGTVLDERMTLAAFGNTTSYGGGMLICPTADPCDGLLDITVIGKAGRLKAALVFRKVFEGGHVGEKEVTVHRTRRATVEFLGDRTMNAYADGDFMMPMPVVVEAVPGAGRYLVPAPAPED